MDILSKQITGLVIPDQHGSSGDVSYDLTGFVIFLFVVYPIACFHMCEYLISFCLLYGMSNLEINHIFCIYYKIICNVFFFKSTIFVMKFYTYNHILMVSGINLLDFVFLSFCIYRFRTIPFVQNTLKHSRV